MMIVDCMTCPVRGQRCEDCVVTVLLVPGSAELPLDPAERNVVSMFVSAGLTSAASAGGLIARREPMGSLEGWGDVGEVG